MLSGEDKRVLPRLGCSIAVGAAGKSASLGEIIDINLDGGRILTQQALPVGSHLPLVFQLGSGQAPISAEAEVVRTAPDFMGVRFVKLSRPDSRKLRRFVVDLTAISGHRDAASRLHDHASAASVPIREAALIEDLLSASIATKVAHVIIPAERQLRVEAPLQSIAGNSLGYRNVAEARLLANEFVFVLYTIDFVSYSFQAQVTSVDGESFVLRRPDLLHYSERRSSRRVEAAPDSRLEMTVSWRKDTMSWPLIEKSETGFSFWSSEEQNPFLLGTPLKGAVLVVAGEVKDLTHAVVKNISPNVDSEGRTRLRVGVEFGSERAGVSLQQTEASKENKEESEKKKGKVAAWANLLSRKVSFAYHKKKNKAGSDRRQETIDVAFDNAKGEHVAGLLNTTFVANQRVRAPLVIVVPGYGGRKETFCALAHTVVHNFRRQYRDVAVLRMDSTNNLGESYKAPGSEKEGASNLKYTVSGCMADLAGAVKWAQSNRHVDATDIVVISSSFSSIAVRRFLTEKEGNHVSHWFVMMGASDAQNCILHVAGNLDIYGNFLRGIKNGVISLIGCLVDADHFCEDLSKHKLATIDDARRDMAAIKAHITWMIGKQDGYMDPRRIRDIMTVKSSGRREMIEVNSGHLPRSSHEALEHFALLTGRIWQHFFQASIRCETPSMGFLDSVSEKEWKRVRRGNMKSSREYWKTYLLGQDEIGFDVLTLSPYYRQLVADQVRLAEPEGKRVLDLGAGTGNVSEALSRKSPQSMVAVDLVDLALERLRKKVAGRVPLSTHAASADGSPMVAYRRWLQGEVAGLTALSGRLPGLQQSIVEQLTQHYSAAVHAKARGAEIDLKHIKGAMRMEARARDALQDLSVISRHVRGLLSRQEAAKMMRCVSPSIFEGHRGLPLKSADFQTVVCSLVLSYLEHPEEALSEMMRVLEPGGLLVISSMKRDADSSMLYQDLIGYLEKAPEAEIAEGGEREKLISAARDFSNHAADLLRFEEEGVFTFWSGDELTHLVQQAGFIQVEACASFGTPGQAVIVTGRKPCDA